MHNEAPRVLIVESDPFIALDQPFTSATIAEAPRAIGCARPAP